MLRIVLMWLTPERLSWKPAWSHWKIRFNISDITCKIITEFCKVIPIQFLKIIKTLWVILEIFFLTKHFLWLLLSVIWLMLAIPYQIFKILVIPIYRKRNKSKVANLGESESFLKNHKSYLQRKHFYIDGVQNFFFIVHIHIHILIAG